MAIPASETEICNMALDWLTNSSVNDIINPKNREEIKCAQWYDATRREVLRLASWNFATKRTNLAKDATAPAFEYDSRYLLPADYIRLAQIGQRRSKDGRFKSYVIEGNYILLNRDELNEEGDALPIRYVCDFKTVSKMEPLFVAVFVLQLAVNLAKPITNKSFNEIAGLKEEYNDKKQIALSIDGQESPPLRYSRSSFVRSRSHGHYRDYSRLP